MWRVLCCRSEEQTPREEKRKSKKVKLAKEESLGTVDREEEEKLILQKKNKVKAEKKKEKELARVQEEKERVERGEKKDSYEGEEHNGKPHGIGIKNYVNGDYYRGEWVNGLKEGRGTHSYFELQSRYEGEWKQNLKNGNGKYIQENGSYYEGEFKDGVKHGKGIYFDNVKQVFHNETYDNGQIQQRKELKRENDNISEQFPTLVLDKQRFNTQDLDAFEKANPEIKELKLDFLLKYYGLCKVINLDFIDVVMSEWKIKEVHAFLTQLNLQDYKEIFYQNKIKGKDLLDLEEDEMKNDLNMKLGDRKKLRNYIGYITSLDKKGKDKRTDMNKRNREKLGKMPRNKQFNSRMVRTIGQEIIEEDDEYRQDSQSSSRNEKGKEFETDWDQFNSTAMEFYHSLKEEPNKRSKHSKDEKESHASVKGSESDPHEEGSPAVLRRKRSEDKEALFNNNFRKSNNNNGGINKKQKSQGSNTSTSSVNSSSQEIQLKRKKTTATGHNQEIRELYEFLKENQSLNFIIKPKDIEITDQIGEGGYGKVYRGKYMSTPVAIKDYIKAGRHNKSRDDFMKEVEIFSDLKHPNIVLYMGMCITVSQYQLVTEYMNKGSLFDQIHKKKTSFIPEEQLEIIDDIARGMVYLHNMKDMLHRDLKSSNVLIADDWKVKLCDFGLSGHKPKSKKKKKNKIGTYQWMAPEVIRNEEMDFFSDVYSFGVIIWEILTEEIPYEGLSETQITGLIGYDEKHCLHDPPEGCSGFIVNIMKKCLNRDPRKRPTFIQIQKQIDNYRRHNPITKILWEDK